MISRSGTWCRDRRAAPRSRRAWALGVAAGLVLVGAGDAAVGAVRLELRVPEAETRVLGDAIPLLWRFGNEGPESLGFLWEGCCRLNGRLDVRAGGAALPTAPPGQALAHMFAKADRLDPGVPKEYETRVSDWVTLPGTGTYDLEGTYRGVLPTQFPQVGRGLALWRDAAQSPPIRLTVLGVEDYLAQRPRRERTRGLRLTLDGPAAWPPLGVARFSVAFENLGNEAATVRWPDDVAFWVLDARSARVAPAAVIQGTATNLLVPAGGRTAWAFDLPADRLEGEPLGDYRVFVDLAEAGPGRPRVPSGDRALAWHPGAEQVAELVRAAARGSGTGARNAPLKLLRVYLAEWAGVLEGMDRQGWTPEAVSLADRLVRAARLKPISPRAGRVELELKVPAEGAPAWVSPRVAEVAAAAGPAWEPQVGELLSLRRHLGWDIALVLAPEDPTPVRRLEEVASALAARSSELASLPAVRLPVGGTNAPAWVVPSASAPREGDAASGPGLRVTATGAEWTDDGAAFRPWTGPPSGAAGEWVRVWAAPELAWGRVREVLAASSRPGERWELGIR